MVRSLTVAFFDFFHALRWWVSRVSRTSVGHVLWPAGAVGEGWSVSHGNPAGTSYRNVVTAPAVTPLRVVSGLGTFADGISAIVSSEGNVFLGTREGKVIALRANGAFWWEHQLASGWSVQSTPAVNSRGELFVLASRRVTDHRDGVAVKHIEMQLLAFNDGGGLRYQATVPARGNRGGFSTAPLNIVRGPADTEAVVFPVLYLFSEGYYRQLWIMAYDRFGVLEAQAQVADRRGTMTNFNDWGVSFEFGLDGDPNDLPERFQPPLHGVAVPYGNGLDSSIVVVNDGLGSVARYRFSGRFVDGFTETERWVQGERDPATSPPVVALNGAVLFDRPSDVLILQTDGGDQRRSVDASSEIRPAVFPNGRIIHAALRRLQEAGGGPKVDSGTSFVSPTASRNHLYRAELERLATYRIGDLSLAATFAWRFGGRHQPALGPLGHIYALTYNQLYIFPPDPSVAAGTHIGPGGVGGVER